MELRKSGTEGREEGENFFVWNPGKQDSEGRGRGQEILDMEIRKAGIGRGEAGDRLFLSGTQEIRKRRGADPSGGWGLIS